MSLVTTISHAPPGTKNRVAWALAVALAVVMLVGNGRMGRQHSPQPAVNRDGATGVPQPAPDPPAHPARLQPIADAIVQGAKAEVRRGVRYDPRYQPIEYPWGDVPADRGACTDVIIRALRHADCDLQALIHQDMRHHFRRYPARYGLHAPDPNIDHRRIANQITFLRQYGLTLTTSTSGAAAETWQPGDLVFWRLPNGLDHCGVVSDTHNSQGLPLVIHNLGQASEEDCLTRWRITGHFRYPIQRMPAADPASPRSGPEYGW